MTLWKSPNPAVAEVNARMTAAGHDMTTNAANPRWYGLHRQRAEQMAFALLPEKHHREAPRLMAEHLHWLGRVSNRWRKDGWHWRYDNHERLKRALCCPAIDTIKKATSDLRKADLLESRSGFVPGTTTTATHYRVTDAAHIVLSALTLSGVADLTDAEWLELVFPTDGSKALRDVLEGWKGVHSPEALNALLEALKAAVVRVAGDTKAYPLTFYEVWRKSVKANYDDPGIFTSKQQARIAPILKELRQAAGEPGVMFKYNAEAIAALADRVASNWEEFAALVKAATGKKLPDTPDLDKLGWHVPQAIKLAFSPEPALSDKAKGNGWT